MDRPNSCEHCALFFEALKFGYTILYVNDVSKSIAFYEAAFGFKAKFVSPDNQYGELETGGTTLSFAAIELAQSNLPDGFTQSNLADKPFAIEIGFVTDNVQQAVDTAIASGATLVANPKTKPWGQTVAYIRDIDGFLIELCTPMG